MKKALVNFLRDEEGATAVEYGLIIAGIAAVIIATVFLLGGTVDEKFSEVEQKMSGAGGAP